MDVLYIAVIAGCATEKWSGNEFSCTARAATNDNINERTDIN
jgi:hypothetical protein